MVRYSIVGRVVRDDVVPVRTFELAAGAERLTSIRDAERLLSSYLVCLIMEGGTATYSRAEQEFRVVMPDGLTEYIQAPREV